MFLTIGTQKGGVGKSTITEQLAAVFGHRGSDVAVLQLDSNGSFHRRFVQDHHREPPRPEDDDYGLTDERRWPHDRRLNHLLLHDDNPDVDGRYLYRRDDLPGVGVLFHEYGTLSSLANQVSSPGTNRKLRSLISYLADNYDWVLVDTPPDFENKIVVEAMLVSDAVLPTTDLSHDGVMAAKETYQTAVLSDIPMYGFVVNPYHRGNDTEARASDMTTQVWSANSGLHRLLVPKDATVKHAQEDCVPLVLYRPEKGQRVDGTHLYDDKPPKALVGLQQLADWLTDLKQDDGRTSRWQQRRQQALQPTTATAH